MNQLFCDKGVNYLVKQIETLEKTKTQLNQNPTVNAVHRARTSSRRLRSAIQFYRKYLKPDIYSTYSKEFKGIMDSSAELRDLDVLLGFLRKEVHKDKARSHKAGFDRLKLRLQQRREKLEKSFVQLVNEFQGKKAAKELSRGFEKKHRKKKEKNNRETKLKVQQLLIKYIHKSSEVTNSYHDYVIDESKVEELHDYRKVVKTQRYTIEFFNQQFRYGLQNEIKKLKIYQDELGYIHDADIWIDLFNDFLKKEEKRVVKFYGRKSPMNEIAPGIQHLIKNLHSERKKMYDVFVDQFQADLGNDFWIKLYNKLVTDNEKKVTTEE
jgi:CHAD domain-containing protein